METTMKIVVWCFIANSIATPALLVIAMLYYQRLHRKTFRILRQHDKTLRLILKNLNDEDRTPDFKDDADWWKNQ